MSWKIWYRHLWNSCKNSDSYSYWFLRYSVTYETNSVVYRMVFYHLTSLHIIFEWISVYFVSSSAAKKFATVGIYLDKADIFTLWYSFHFRAIFLCDQGFRSCMWHFFEAALLDSGKILRLMILCKNVH